MGGRRQCCVRVFFVAADANSAAVGVQRGGATAANGSPGSGEEFTKQPNQALEGAAATLCVRVWCLREFYAQAQKGRRP